MSSITFTCACGKHLKARAKSAGRLTMCPRCRQPVAVPKLEANHRGVEELSASLTGANRSTVRSSAQQMSGGRSASPSPAAKPTFAHRPPQAATPEAKSPRVQQQPSRTRSPVSSASSGNEEITLRKEPRWKQLCTLSPGRGRVDALEFSLGSFPAVAATSISLAFASVACLRMLPDAFKTGFRDLPELLAVLAAAVLSAAFASLFLTRTVSAELSGKPNAIVPIDFDVTEAMKSLAVWLGCMMCGPIPLAGVGAWYWIQCGELQAMDYVILAEIAIVAIASGLFAVRVACGTGRVWHAHPVRLLDEAVAAGLRGTGVLFLACGVVALHVGLAYVALTEAHHSAFNSFLLMAVLWFSGMYQGSFVLRRIARCAVCHRPTRDDERFVHVGNAEVV